MVFFVLDAWWSLAPLPGNRRRCAYVDIEPGGEEQRTIPALVDRRRTRALLRP